MLASTVAAGVVLSACNSPAAGGDPKFISIGTGGTGGTAYPVGGAFSSILSKKLDVKVTAETTGGSIDNIRLVAEGEVDMGQIQADVAYEGCHGKGRFDGQRLDNVNTYVVLYPNVLAPVWLNGSGIDSVSDLKGKTVGVGDQGSGTDLFAEKALGALGITYDDISVNHLPLADQTSAFRDGQLDAAFWSSPRVGGTASLIDLAATEDVAWTGFTKEEQQKIADRYPYYDAGVIPSGTFKGQDEDFPVAVVWHNYLGRADLSEDFVYRLVKNILASADEVAKSQPAIADVAPENIQYTQCPVHPGAARAYREAGYDVPDELVADSAS